MIVAPLEREPSFYRLVVPLKSLGKTLQFSHSLLFDELEPGVQLLPLPLTKHGGEVLDKLIRVQNLLVSLTQTREIVLLPIKPLLFLKRDPMRNLQSSGGTLFLPFIGMDQQFRLGLDRLELVSLAFEGPPGSDKATPADLPPVYPAAFISR